MRDSKVSFFRDLSLPVSGDIDAVCLFLAPEDVFDVRKDIFLAMTAAKVWRNFCVGKIARYMEE